MREEDKVEGLLYALADDGMRLPVVDLSNPAFVTEFSPVELDALTRRYLRAMRLLRWMPGFLVRAMSRRSLLLGESAMSQGFLTGMATYLHKLGPDLLPARCTSSDRRLAAGLMAVAIRLRLRAMSELLAETLAAVASARPGAPVQVINIAGGPATDSLNALILATSRDANLLRDRAVSVELFDLDDTGPRFAQCCLAALSAEGAPLQGLPAVVRHSYYNWADPSVLRRDLTDPTPEGAVMVGSSEGGLFEYGKNEEVAENLETLRDITPRDFAFVGSSFRSGALWDMALRVSPLHLANRTFCQLVPLVNDAGWTIDRVVEGNPQYQVFRLSKR
jgi:hypothetical protein